MKKKRIEIFCRVFVNAVRDKIIFNEVAMGCTCSMDRVNKKLVHICD
jgi:hypothetical protein